MTTYRQTSMNLTPATEAQLDYLKAKGFGGTTDVVRIAIDRMATQEGMNTMYTKYTMIEGRRDEPVTITEVWTDGSDPSHDGSFAASAWGREDATGIPADAEPFGWGAWRRTTTYYPE